MGKLVWRNLLRNKRRTLLTIASVALALFLLSLLGAFLGSLEPEDDPDARQLVVRNRISLTFDLPQAYWQRLRSIEHVVEVTTQNWFGGIYKDTRPENYFPRFAGDPQTWRRVFSNYEMPEEQFEAWAAERTACVAGKSLVERQGWALGERIHIKGDIYPVDLDLTLRGIFTFPGNEGAERQLWFHHQYLEEALGNPGSVGNYWLLLDRPESADPVIRDAEAMFLNSADQVRAETGAQFARSFTQMMGNVQFLFGAIGLAIVVSIFFIVANTMAMAARERTSEVAVLRTLGFRKGQVVSLVVAESVAVGLLGAGLGILMAYGVLEGIASRVRDMGFFWGQLGVSPERVGLGLLIGLGIGLLSGTYPALAAARLRIVDGLRRVA